MLLAVAGIVFLVFKYHNPIKQRKLKKRNNETKIESEDQKPKEEKRREETEDTWLGLIKMNPKNPLPYKKLGEYYARNNQIQYAVKTWEHALKLNPKDEALREKLKKIQIS